MKKKKTILYASRFVIILLSIFAQAIGSWLLLYLLGKDSIWFNVGIYVVGFILFLSIVNKEQSAVYKLPWVILFLAFPFGGIMVYLTFGNVKVSKKQMLKYRTIYDEANDGYYNQKEVIERMDKSGGKSGGIIKYIRKTTSLPVLDNSLSTYLKDGETFYFSLLDELKKAEKYIFLEYFIIDDCAMWSGIERILKEKIAVGVDVYLMYDAVGNMPRVTNKFFKSLLEEGIKAKIYHKFRPIVSVTHNNRDHRKIAVIDGKVGFMGGANIADEYINADRPFGRWVDNTVKIEGQAVDGFVRLFIQLYNMAGGEELDVNDFLCTSHQEYKDGYIISFGDSPKPISYDHIGENVYLDIINRADKYLYIATPYLIVDTNISFALQNAVKRGVDVRIIIPEIPDKKLVYILTKSSVESLIKSGVKFYKYRDGFIHSKAFVSDDEIAVIGTINLDYRSLVHHFECATVLYQTQSIKDIYADFNYLSDYESNEIKQSDKLLKWYEKLIKTVLILFAPMM